MMRYRYIDVKWYNCNWWVLELVTLFDSRGGGMGEVTLFDSSPFEWFLLCTAAGRNHQQCHHHVSPYSPWSCFVPDQCWWSWDVGQFQAPSRSALAITCYWWWSPYNLHTPAGTAHHLGPLPSSSGWWSSLFSMWLDESINILLRYLPLLWSEFYYPLFADVQGIGQKASWNPSKERWPWL